MALLLFVLLQFVQLVMPSFDSLKCLQKNAAGRLFVDCRKRNLTYVIWGIDQQTEILDMAENKLEFIRSYEFQEVGLLYLRELDLSHNKIANIETQALRGLRSLRKLDLSYNQLMTLPHLVFNINHNLQVLNLSHNPLKQTQPLGGYHIQELDVSSCLFSEFQPKVFLESKELLYLNAADNNMHQIKKEDLMSCNSLKSLRIDGNPLQCGEEIEELKDWLQQSGISFPTICLNQVKPTSRSMTSGSATVRTTREELFPEEFFPEVLPQTRNSELFKARYESWMIHALIGSISLLGLIFNIITFILIRRYISFTKTAPPPYAREDSHMVYI